MAATATASAAPRYAPEDPTLPKPWKGLVDGKTGYLYFWNPETNVTQYEKPTSTAPPSKPPSAQYNISSSVQVQQSSQGQRHDEGDDRYGRGSNGGSKFDVGPRNVQSAREPLPSNNGPSGSAGAPGGSAIRSNGPSDSGLSAEAYCRRHEITVIGDNVPPPFTSFEATGFPSEILREVRYLLLAGANVVRCAALLWGLANNLERPFMVDKFL